MNYSHWIGIEILLRCEILSESISIFPASLNTTAVGNCLTSQCTLCNGIGVHQIKFKNKII